MDFSNFTAQLATSGINIGMGNSIITICAIIAIVLEMGEESCQEQAIKQT